jgi:hypothetical protein
MIAAWEAGLRHFGENRIQDALAKQAVLPPDLVDGVTWHLIGPLQRNKVTKAVGAFSLIHSVENLALAEKIAIRASALGEVQAVLLQVNMGREPQKHGFIPEALDGLLPALLALPALEVRGLMTVAPHTQAVSQLQEVFFGLAHLRDRLAKTYLRPLPELSMGMSGDYGHAIACGATIIRVGAFLFGEADDL